MEGERRGGSNIFAAIVIIILLCIIGFLIWWFGYRNTNTTTGPNQAQTTAATKNTIKSNWMSFFSGQTPANQKIGLLQNGQQFSQVIQADSQTPTAKATAATVSNVALNGNNTATVTYTIDINQKPALQNQKGQAVLANGVWKVSDTAFCNLLKLSGSLPPNCPGAASSSGSNAQLQQPAQQSNQSPTSQ